ncbi:MAG: polysaccharide deacetylase family protein [Bradymonadia bacterium]
MFHRVLPDTPVSFGLPDCYRIRGTALTASELVRVVDEAGPIVPLEVVEAALREGTDPPPGAVLTFDDGYREHLNVVAPMLAERAMTATFYVATGLNGAGRAVAAVDAWYWLLDHAKGDRACIPLADGRVHSGRFDTLVGKSDWVTGEPKAAFLAADPARQWQMLEALAEGARCELPSDLAGQLYMGPGDWVELVRRGMRLGAHSIRHPTLTRASDAVLDEEVAGSVAAIRAICSPVAFAYPDGAFDERVAERVRQSSASSAVTCIPGDVARDTDAMRLPRRFIATPVHQG